MNRIILFSTLALFIACSSSTTDSNSSSTANKGTAAGAQAAPENASASGSSIAGSDVSNPEATPETAVTGEKTGKAYVINGKIANAANQTVNLEKYTISQQNQKVQEVKTDATGAFTMKGSLTEKGLYLIMLNQKVNWLIVLDEGTINFTADANNIYSYSAEGSPEAKAFAAFVVKAGQDQQALFQLKNQYNQAQMTRNQQAMMTAENQYQVKFAESQTYIRKYVDTTAYPLLAVFGASILDVQQNTNYLQTFISKAETKLPGSTYVADLKQRVNSFVQQQKQQAEAAKRLAMGGVAPDFEVKNPKGEKLKLSSLKGKVVLVDFWASWCRPCRQENPNVVRLYDKYNSMGFEVFSVSLDKSLESWVAAIQQDNLKWKNHGSNLMYWQEPVAKLYEVSSIPQTFLLDKQGKIIGKNLRGADLEMKLKEIFGS